jgi:hypothetical protein
MGVFMFGWLKDSVSYCKKIFERALTEPDVNSRLIFLSTAVVTSLLMIGHFFVYAVGLFHGKPIDPAYPTVLAVLLGGHGVNGIARYFTKKDGGDGGNGNPNPAPDPNAPAVPPAPPAGN